jgi:hypothetical protein
MSAMTTMSAAFCVKAPVAAKASAKVRVLAARLTPRCRAARRRHRNFFRSRKRRRNAGPDPSLTPHPPFRPQVAYGAPVKAFKASAFSVKAARRTGVVAMSAATDDIIEKMKGLTVSARPPRFSSWGLGFARRARRRATMRATTTRRATAKTAGRVVCARVRRPAASVARRVVANAPASRRAPARCARVHRTPTLKP